MYIYGKSWRRFGLFEEGSVTKLDFLGICDFLVFQGGFSLGCLDELIRAFARICKNREIELATAMFKLCSNWKILLRCLK